MAPVQIGIGSGSSPVGVNRRETVKDKTGKPMITLGRNPSGPRDPEVQVLLPLLKTDLLALMNASIDGTLDQLAVEESCDVAVIVMLASKGYPGDYEKGFPITGIEEAAAREGVIIFHSATARRGPTYVTNGGRVLGVAATAPDIRTAVERAYAAIGDVHFEGMHYRRDIGRRALARLK